MKQDIPELTPRQRSQISALKKLSDDQINTADIPEVLDWSNVARGRVLSTRAKARGPGDCFDHRHQRRGS